MKVIGGEKTIPMDTLDLSATLVDAFTSRPVQLQELYLVSSTEVDGVSRMVAMDTLTLVGSPEGLTVV